MLEFVKELTAEMRKQEPGEREAKLRLLLDRLALADVPAPGEVGWPTERVLVLIGSIGEQDTARELLAGRLCSKYSRILPEWQPGVETSEMSFGLEFVHWRHVRRHDEDRVWWEEFHDSDVPRDRYCFNVLLAEGYRARQFLEYEMGTHLFVLPDGRLEPVRTVVAPVAEGRPHWDALRDVVRRHEQAMEAAGGGEPADDPLAWRPTISLHGPNGFVTDLQSGAAVSSGSCALMASLPLPPEFRDLLDPRGTP